MTKDEQEKMNERAIYPKTQAELDFEQANKNKKFCYLYYEINKQKLLAGILSENFCATQFHPELSGDLWQQFMINFFK